MEGGQNIYNEMWIWLKEAEFGQKVTPAANFKYRNLTSIPALVEYGSSQSTVSASAPDKCTHFTFFIHSVAAQTI